MKIAILTMIWNEEKRLLEWINFHKKVHDVDKFVFYLDHPDDNTKILLDSIKDKYNIEYFDTDIAPNNIEDRRLGVISGGTGVLGGWDKRQHRMLTKGMMYLKDKVDWVAVIDVDEFIVPNENKKIKDVLPDIESSLYIPSYFFNPPVDVNKSIREWNFYRVSDSERIRIGTGETGKSITKTEKYNGESVSPHYVQTKEMVERKTNSVDFKMHHFRTSASVHSSKAVFEVYDDSILNFMG